MINLAKSCIFEKTNKKARPLVILIKRKRKETWKNDLRNENRDITLVTERLKERERLQWKLFLMMLLGNFLGKTTYLN